IRLVETDSEQQVLPTRADIPSPGDPILLAAKSELMLDAQIPLLDHWRLEVSINSSELERFYPGDRVRAGRVIDQHIRSKPIGIAEGHSKWKVTAERQHGVGPAESATGLYGAGGAFRFH